METCTETSGESEKRKHQAVPRTRTRVYAIHGNQLSGTSRNRLKLHERLGVVNVEPVLGLSADRNQVVLPQRGEGAVKGDGRLGRNVVRDAANGTPKDRKSTRLNSSHVKISYAVFCLKKTPSVNMR